MTEKSSTDVSEIAAGHAGDNLQVFFGQLRFQACHSIEIIESLGQETGHIDTVGRGEHHVTTQLFVHKSTLHQALTIVENTVYLYCRNVFPQCGELTFLDGTHLAFGIKHIDMDSLDAEESVGHGTARVATGSHQHVHRLLCFKGIATCRALLADEVLQ